MAADHQVRIAALSACLALVRPIGMTEDETLDWLEVAADTLSHLPAHILQDGARVARTKCTHHSQIVPMIVTETQDALAWHLRPKSPPALRLVAPATCLPDLPLPDPATLNAPLRRLGITAGWIAERDDGRLEWTEEGAA